MLSVAIVWPLAGVVADAFRLRGAFWMYASGTLLLGGGALLLWSRAEEEEARDGLTSARGRD